ncbi:hypothetical protein KDK_16680 [Dictyobacter kobayashii]|uniref:Uncharacterized protein n=1 Tax=Dictyobacter kobayashii TaxID=2014872 RepID=A0A402AFI0_9CHLR|nr:hypothetical protein KDK_16680 [Dictyobacter kobayashii]
MRGHFSTPPLLVEQILDACGYTPDKDLSGIRVLDPACGSGNFLAGAAHRLLSYGKRSGLSVRNLARYTRDNIWGFDPDPIACTLAELQLRSTFDLHHPGSHALHQLHVHQADGLAFPWEQSKHIDLFLANPPYLAAKNNDLSGYRSTHQRGQVDSYLLFLNLALQVVRPGGWIGLVLPDPVLARTNATLERQRLLAETTISHIWHLADVFAAYVGAVVIVAQKTPPPSHHQINWQRKRWIDRIPELEVAEVSLQLPLSNTVSQALLSQQPGAELRYLLSTIKDTIIERLQRQLHTQVAAHVPRTLACLGECMLIRRGEELGKDSPLLKATPPMTDELRWYPVLRGGIDIRPYEIPIASCWIAREQIVKPVDRYLAPKILLVKSAGRLQATLDVQGHVVLQTLYILQLNVCIASGEEEQAATNSEDELYFFLALLNSRILQDYLYTLHTAYKWVQPQIEQYVLAQLPIPINVAYPEKVQIIDRAKLLMHACSKSSSVVELKAQSYELYEEQERAICALYQAALQQRRVTEPPRDVVDEGVSLYG